MRPIGNRRCSRRIKGQIDKSEFLRNGTWKNNFFFRIRINGFDVNSLNELWLKLLDGWKHCRCEISVTAGEAGGSHKKRRKQNPVGMTHNSMERRIGVCERGETWKIWEVREVRGWERSERVIEMWDLKGETRKVKQEKGEKAWNAKRRGEKANEKNVLFFQDQ